MEHIKFNKTTCGVDFLLNILDFEYSNSNELPKEVRSTDFFQIIFIKQASGKMLLNQTEISLSDNSIIFISQYQKYQWKIDDNRNLNVRVLVFQEDFLNEFFADKYFTYRFLYFYQTQYSLQINIDELDFENYLTKLVEIKKELVVPKNDSAHFIRSLLYYLLIHLNRIYSKINGVESAIALDNTAYEFRKLVEQHIYFKQRVKDYTSLMGISRITLNKSVKAQFNVTASDFIKSKLLFEIKMKLLYSTLSVNEISKELNFSEPNHLSRLFKNKEGITPIEYRENYQNGSS